VRITGTWSHPDYAVQWDAIRNQTIQQAVKSGLMDLMKGRDLLDQVLPTPEPETHTPAPEPKSPSDAVGRIGNALKGLLGQ